MTIDEPANAYSPAEVHIAMLSLFPELGEDFGLEAILDAFGYWAGEQSLAGEEEKVATALRCLETLVAICPPELARQAVESMFKGEDWHREIPAGWIGPQTRAILQSQAWWP